MPTMPIVFSESSWPVFRCQPPLRTESVWNSRFFSSARSSRKACSATVVWLTPGVNSSGMPTSVQAGTSILSTPMPYLESTFSRGLAFSSTARLITSSPQMKPSISPTRASVSPSESGPRARTTSQPVAASVLWCGPGVSWNDVVVTRMRVGMADFRG